MLFASFGTVTLLLHFLLASFLGAFALQRDLRAEASAHLQVLSQATDEDIQTFYAALRTHPAVAQAEFVSREEVFERERESNPDLIAFLEQYDLENPFPDSFVVLLTSEDRYGELAAFLQDERWQTVIDPSFVSSLSKEEGQSHSFLSLTRGAIAFLAFLSLLCLLGIALAVASHARQAKEDTQTMLLLGASRREALAFLVGRFSLVLVVSALASFLLLLLCILLLQTVFAFLPRLLTLSFLLPLLLIPVFFAPALAFGGAALALSSALPSAPRPWRTRAASRA